MHNAVSPERGESAGPRPDPAGRAAGRRAEAGRYLLAVNTTLPPLDPGMLWRVSVHVASCLPVSTRLTWHPEPAGAAGRTVVGPMYDVFAMRQVAAADPTVPVDLRTLPARILAVLPAAIDRVEIGYTWLAQRAQRTAVNTEAKYLMLKHAFEVWGCVRVELKTDALNERSRNAILLVLASGRAAWREGRPTWPATAWATRR